MNFEKDEIIHLTKEYGGQWGINHTLRLLMLIPIIAESKPYNEEAVWLAAHLHDWGGYGKWLKKDVDHAIRSRQVAEPFLVERKLPEDFIKLVLECIEFHHSGDMNRSFESILLSDADALDFLGVVGVLRDFSKKPQDLAKAYETVQKRRKKLPKLICLKKSKEIAKERIMQMDELLTRFKQDTWGYF